MKRSSLALGTSVLALALGAGPAQAEAGATQSVDDTTGAAQVGAVAVDAPVRVASDGDSQSAGAAIAAPQTTTDSTGGAQVSSVEANAPVRVLSDGDDSGSAGSGAGGGSAGDQSTGGSQASAQVGSPGVAAPVRVADDGDTTSGADSAGATGGSQTVGDSSGAAQVGSPRLFAPVRVLGGGQTPGDDGSGLDDDVGELLGRLEGDLLGGGQLGGDDTIGSIASMLLGGGDGPTPQQTRGLRDRGAAPYTRPVVDLYSGGAPIPGDGGPGSDVGDVSTLGAAGGTLPLTGAGFVALLGMGLSLLSAGAALRRIP